jgi:hypothetical protein
MITCLIIITESIESMVIRLSYVGHTSSILVGPVDPSGLFDPETDPGVEVTRQPQGTLNNKQVLQVPSASAIRLPRKSFPLIIHFYPGSDQWSLQGHLSFNPLAPVDL